MSRNITGFINTTITAINTRDIIISDLNSDPNYNMTLEWSDMAVGKLTDGDVLVAIAGNTNVVLYSIDNGNTWHTSLLPYNTNGFKIVWFSQMNAFIIIAYDADYYIMSNVLTTREEILSTNKLSWSKVNFAKFNENPKDSNNNSIGLAIANTINVKSKWYNIIATPNTLETSTKSDTFNQLLLTTRNYNKIFRTSMDDKKTGSVISNWIVNAYSDFEYKLGNYILTDLCCTNKSNGTTTDVQFAGLGLSSDKANGIITVSYYGSAADSWSIHPFTNAAVDANNNVIYDNWIKIHPYTSSSGTFSGIYAVSSKGYIAYLEDCNFDFNWLYAATYDSDKLLGKITSANSILVDTVVKKYIMNAGPITNSVTVADDTARFALTTNNVSAHSIVIVTSTGNMYDVVDVNNLSSEKGYLLYYKIDTITLNTILNNIDTKKVIDYNEIKTYLYDISQKTDVTVTVKDILVLARHETNMNVPSSYKYVTVKTEAEKNALTSSNVSVGYIVRVTDTSMLYKVTAVTATSATFDSYGIPFYVIPKAPIRNKLYDLTTTQLNNTLTYLRSTGNFTFTETDQATYVTNIKASSTGYKDVPETIIDGMIDYISRFYKNPSYDGTTDKIKYKYGIEDSNIFDTNYADIEIFSAIYDDVLSDIKYKDYTDITAEVIDFVINYILNNQSSCLDSTIIQVMFNEIKTALITYVTNGYIINENITLDLIESFALKLSDDVISNTKDADVYNKILKAEIANILYYNTISWNDVKQVNDTTYIALSNVNIVATASNFTNWTYHILDNEYYDFNNVVYTKGGAIEEYVLVMNNSNVILTTTDLFNTINKEVTINSGKSLNNIYWSTTNKKLCLTDGIYNDHVYIGKFTTDADNNTSITFSNTLLKNNYAIKSITYNSISGNFALLTEDSSIIFVSSIYPYSSSIISLSDEKVKLLDVDYNTGEYCAFTKENTVITAKAETTEKEKSWNSKTIQMGLDSLMCYNIANVNNSKSPVFIILQRYGNYKFSNDLVHLICKNTDYMTGWKSICWSPYLNSFCAVDSGNCSMLVDYNGTATYSLNIPELKTSITSIAWVNSWKIFIAVTQCNECIVSEDGLTWYKVVLPYDYNFNKVYSYDSTDDYTTGYHYLFILTNSSNYILVLNTTI
jgi:hypothetical protein